MVRAMERELYIHAGGHRTGSSSFQMCLHKNRDVLYNSGYDLAYPERDGIPSGTLGLRLPNPRHGMGGTLRFSKAVAAELETQNPDPNRPLVLSEENLPGRMIHFYAGQFYPAAEARFTALRRGIGAARIRRILIVVRSYAGLFVSAHRKRAEDQEAHPFSDMTAAMTNIDRGWPELISIMQQILQPEEMVVRTFENRPNSVALVQDLLGDAPKKLSEPKKSLNVSATDAGLVALQKIYATGQRLERSEWQKVIEDHAADKTDHGFASFSSDQKTALDQKYRMDLERLEADKNVNFIR